MNHDKQTLKKMAEWIETIDSIRTQLPTSSLDANHSALFIQHI